MSTQFLNGENVCGETLLGIVSRGSSILAELQRLGGCIPKCYLSTNDSKYQKVIPDFNYFKNIDGWEKEIQDNMELLALDENIKATYLPLIQRFFILFESIYLYYTDLCEFVSQLERGVFIQHTVDNILEITDGKQLMAEGFYQYGVMLLLMDYLIPGQTREKMVVSIYRNKGGDNIDNIDHVRKLCTDTEFRPPGRKDPGNRPENYPEDYFERFPLDPELMSKVIIAIKDDDIYHQASAYPDPKLRSFALSNQSSIIFILLFFYPNALIKGRTTMREITDKHFNNVWVLPYYLGYIADLTYWWHPYKAAKQALSNILDLECIEELLKEFVAKQEQCYEKCKEYLADGLMTQEYVLNKLPELMNCVRDSNITIRWLMLHRKTSQDKLKEMFLANTNPTKILRLLLICSEFENKLKEQCENIIARKEEIWNEDRTNCIDRMTELSEYFGGARALGKIQANDEFRDWFKTIADTLEGLTYSDSTSAGRKIQKLIKALEEVQQYQQIYSNIQIKQYLNDTKEDLKHMVKVVNVKESIKTHLEIITDITWCWIALKDYIQLMQAEVKKNPDVALLLKNTFTKLSSILNTPMVRVVQANSLDIASVSKYYSNQLIRLVKDVLQIIPGSVFDSLGGLINLLTNLLKTFPQKFDKAELLQYSQFKQRKEMAKLTNEIAVFAESVLTMQSYLVGVIQVNPREILQDGIKKELIKLIAKTLDSQLIFKVNTIEDFQLKLKVLSGKMQGLKISLQYVQDFIRSYGLKVYYQEFERLMECYIDMEKISLLTHKIGFEQLNYDDDIPMPSGNDTHCNNFMGRLLFQIINLTDYKRSIFLYSTYAFYELNTGKEVFTLKTLEALYKCIGVSGLQGLDHLLSVQIMMNMKSISNHLNKDFDENTKRILIASFKTLKDFNSYNEKYEHIVVNLKKCLKPLHANINISLMKIGQYIILRDIICLKLQMLAKVGSNRLYLVMDNVNKTIRNDILNREYTADMMSDANIEAENSLLSMIGKYCNYLGMSEPLRKIYITVKPVNFLPLIMFVMVSLNIPNVDYDRKLQSLIRKNPKQPFEPIYFTTGMLAFLNQFHPANKQIFYSYIGHYIRSSMNYIMLNKEMSKNPELIGDLFTYIMYFEEMSKVSKEPYGKLKEILDVGLLSELNKHTLKSASAGV